MIQKREQNLFKIRKKMKKTEVISINKDKSPPFKKMGRKAFYIFKDYKTDLQYLFLVIPIIAIF